MQLVGFFYVLFLNIAIPAIEDGHVTWQGIFLKKKKKSQKPHNFQELQSRSISRVFVQGCILLVILLLNFLNDTCK